MCRSATGWPRRWRSWRPSRPSFASRWRPSSTAWSATMCSTAVRLVVAHAGLREELQGRASSRVRDFALYGETTGETDEFGLPVRYNWAAEYRGKAHGGLWPHAGARAGVAQPDAQYRHRLRLWRAADGPALPRARAGVRGGAAGVCRAHAPAPRARAHPQRPAAARRPARYRRCAGQAHRRDEPVRPSPCARSRPSPRWR